MHCPICGSTIENGLSTCPSCGTSFGDERVVCRDCGTELPKDLKSCPNCEVSLLESQKDMAVPKRDAKVEEDERECAISEFLIIPGMTQEKAEKLYDMGFKDMTTLVMGTLDKHGMRKDFDNVLSLSRILVDRILGVDVGADSNEAPSQAGELLECPFCDSPVYSSQECCPVCGANVNEEIIGIDPENLTENIEDFVNNIFSALDKDRDYTALPDDMKSMVSSILGDDGEIDEIDLDAVNNAISGKEPSSGMSASEDEAPGVPEKDDTLASGKEGPPKAKKRAKPGKSVIAIKKGASSQKRAVRVNIVKAENAHELFAKRLEDWKKKGFDCTGLDELLEVKDYVAFKEKSVRMLKKEFKKKKEEETSPNADEALENSDSAAESSTAKEEKPPQDAAPSKETPSEGDLSSQLDEDVVYECPKCGNLVGGSDERCESCGVKFL